MATRLVILPVSHTLDNRAKCSARAPPGRAYFSRSADRFESMLPPMQPMGYAGPGASMPMATAAYEFSDVENLTIAKTARYARLWGIISIVAGVLVLGGGLMLTASAAALASTFGNKAPMLGAIGIALIPTALVNIVGGIFYLQS